MKSASANRSPHVAVCRCQTVVVLILAVACARDPEAAKLRHLHSGQEYARQGKLAEAIIEYRNAVQAQPQDGEARLTLADAYWRARDYRTATEEYARAADLLPSRLDVQLKSGHLLLVTHRFDDAKVRADKALALDPRNVEAHLLLANALAGLDQLEAAIARIEEAIRLAPERGATYANLGTFETERGRYAAAEQAFKRAVALDPKSAPAHLALANFYWARRQLRDVEQSLERALNADPDNVLAHRAMASLKLQMDKPDAAETHLRKVAEISGSPGAILALADFHLSRKDPASARAALQPLVGSPEAAAQAGVRLAALDHADGKAHEAYTRLEKLLETDPANLDALVTRSGLLLADGRADDALRSAQRAVSAHPDAAPASYALGRAHQGLNHYDAALSAYRDVLRVNPSAAAAHAAIAELHLSRGRVADAVTSASAAIGTEPTNPDAKLTFVRSLIAARDLTRAEAELTDLVRRFPRSAAVREQNAMLLMRKGDAAAARREFEEVLSIDPESASALEGLVALDLPDAPAAARARLEGHVARAHASPAVLLVAARTWIATGDPVGGEQLLRRIQREYPAYLPAYTALGQLYMRQRRLDEALREFESLAQQDPRSVAALTTAGVILEAKRRSTEAMQRYERALQIDPTAPVAANNLAWLYATSGRNLDVALQLAQTAYAKAHDNPEVTHTLGFIFYKKDLIPQALRMLRTSVDNNPEQPLFHLHLGLALARNGDSGQAREHLVKALTLDPDFDGASEARAALNALDARR